MNSDLSTKVYHYWNKQSDGKKSSRNATVVTALSRNLRIDYIKEDGNEKGEEHPHLIIRPQLNCVFQGEDELTDALIDHYLVPPPKTALPIKVILRDVQEGTYGASCYATQQDEFLDEFIFKGRVKDGFFIEAGADDFLLNTNTLYFERHHDWTGLLVEPLLSRFNSG